MFLFSMKISKPIHSVPHSDQIFGTGSALTAVLGAFASLSLNYKLNSMLKLQFSPLILEMNGHEKAVEVTTPPQAALSVLW